MKRTSRLVALAGCLALASCATPNPNPPTPAANTGYVDFYTDTSLDLCWEVKLVDETSGEMRTLYSEMKPVPGTVLRLAEAPGNHRFQVWFINRVTQGPQRVEVTVLDGKVTPVHVTLSPAGETSVDTKVYGMRGSTKGYARGTKIVTDDSTVYKIGASADTAQTYQMKERMPYFAAGSK
jgi:hypothetical protein